MIITATLVYAALVAGAEVSAGYVVVGFLADLAIASVVSNG